MTDHANDTYERVTEHARAVRDVVEPFVNEHSYAALGISAAVGLLVGFLLADRGRKVVYIKQRY